MFFQRLQDCVFLKSRGVKFNYATNLLSGRHPLPVCLPGTVLRVGPPRDEVWRVGHALDVHAGVVAFTLHGTEVTEPESDLFSILDHQAVEKRTSEPLLYSCESAVQQPKNTQTCSFFHCLLIILNRIGFVIFHVIVNLICNFVFFLTWSHSATSSQFSPTPNPPAELPLRTKSVASKRL